jgi:transposase
MKRVVEAGTKRTVVRRRSFTEEFRRLVVKETLVPGASVSAVALKHRLNTNLLFTWRRRYLRELASVESVNLLPVRIEPLEARVSVPRAEPLPTKQSAHNTSSPGCIEIEAYGACIRLHGAVEVTALRAVLEVLSGR